MTESNTVLMRERLDRLVRMQGSDPAFFVLSVHSFIEAWLREYYGDYRRTIFLGDLLYRYKTDLSKKSGGLAHTYRVIDEFMHAQDLTNAVRHAFKALMADEARAAADRLSRFCRIAGIQGGKQLEELTASSRLWDERNSRYEDAQRMLSLGYELERARKSEVKLQEELTQYRGIKAERDQLERERAELSTTVDAEREARRANDSKYDEARRRLASLEGMIRSKNAELDSLERAKNYAFDLTRLTLYNRTRLEHERELVRLSPEQQRILNEITLGDDFLIKGGAGTGKTLVLLKALEKLFEAGSRHPELNLPKPTYVLITYSNTLVKYDRYVASIIDVAERDDRIISADSYLDAKFAQAFPDCRIDQGFFRGLIAKACTVQGRLLPSAVDLEAEMEDFLFANDVNESEYCIQSIDRSGMRRRLDPTERLAVWKTRQTIVTLMESSRVYSRNYARTRLAQAAVEDACLRTEDLIFVDEVQDLAPCDLMALKALSRKAIIMAGDNEQAIFRKGFSFRRAGINIVGRSRTINLNFRNTVPINELAERFRERALSPEEREGGSSAKSREHPSQAFRPGPPPELLTAGTEKDLEKLLVEKVRTYLDLLGYAPETLTILAPDASILARVQRILGEAELLAQSIDHPGFSFAMSPGVRLSVMKSAKGIDFSATILYLPRLPEYLEAYDPGFNDGVIRNTIYVALTRSMEQLAVIMPREPTSSVLVALANSFIDGGQA